MAERKIPTCDVHKDRDILPNQDLWDRQGGRVHLMLPGYTERMDLCEECMAKLLDEWGGIGHRTFEGTAPSHERLRYLPKKS